MANLESAKVLGLKRSASALMMFGSDHAAAKLAADSAIAQAKIAAEATVSAAKLAAEAKLREDRAEEVRYNNLDSKLDAVHTSLKEDLAEIKVETKRTDGRVSDHDRSISKLQGGLILLAAGLPMITGLLIYFIQNVHLGH